MPFWNRKRDPLRKVVGTEPRWVETPTGWTAADTVEVLECGHRQLQHEPIFGRLDDGFRRCKGCGKGHPRWPVDLTVTDIAPSLPEAPEPVIEPVAVPESTATTYINIGSTRWPTRNGAIALPRQRVVVFIDGSNTYLTFKERFGTGRYDMPQLARSLVGEARDLAEVRFYIGQFDTTSPEYAGQQRFLHAIRARGVVPCLGHFDTDHHEKGVDVQLAIDLVRFAAEDRYDAAIVISRDADLLPAVDTVQQIYHKPVEIAVAAGAPAFDLAWVAATVREITPELFARVRHDD